jgi:hypothetical protein
MSPTQIDKQVRKIHFANQAAQRWHQDIVNKRGHHLPEGGTDDYADCQIQHIAPHCKFFELFQHDSSPLDSVGRIADGQWARP